MAEYNLLKANKCVESVSSGLLYADSESDMTQFHVSYIKIGNLIFLQGEGSMQTKLNYDSSNDCYKIPLNGLPRAKRRYMYNFGTGTLNGYYMGAAYLYGPSGSAWDPDALYILSPTSLTGKYISFCFFYEAAE